MRQFCEVGSIYGAPMGRDESHLCDKPNGPLRVFRVRLNSGGYDDGGAYWGIGHRLYCIQGSCCIQRFYRADDRAMAYRKFARDIGGPFQLSRKLSNEVKP